MRAGFALMAVCTASAIATAGHAGDTNVDYGATLFGKTSASVTYGPYLRFEIGRSGVDLSDPNWLPPGPSDPRVFFDFADQDSTVFGVAAGFDWMNGFRADVGLVSAGEVDATGPWNFTVPADPGPHADITAATVRTTALIGSVFYSPLEQRGVNSRVQPYLVGGLGFARNEMSDWTRTNAASPNPVRTFAGDTSVDLAWSLGAGVSMQVTRAGQYPVLVDLSLRYYDFGAVEGGTTPISGGGGSVPLEALQINRADTVVTLGVRVPLKRY